MAQTQVIATVSSLSGEAYARDSAGKMRRLKAGDAIREGEMVVAADGAQVVLKLADGREMTVNPGETARLDAEVGAPVKPDAADSAIANDQKGFQKIAQALTSGSDLDASLDDPAAGRAGSGGNEGHTFVEFVRVVESVDPLLSLQFGTDRSPPLATLDGGVILNRGAIDTTIGVDAPDNTNDSTPTIGSVVPGAPALTDNNVNEGQTLVFNVSINGTSTGPTSYALNLGGTATGTDTDYNDVLTGASFSNGVTYDSTTGQITVPAGVTGFSVSIPTLTDTVSGEGVETVVLTIGGQTGTGGIVDNNVLAGGNASGTEDMPLVLTWANFGVINAQAADTDLSIRITGLPADGVLQYFDGTNWVALAADSTLSYADIDAGKLRFMPDANESGFDEFNSAGTGNQMNDYATVQFSVLRDGSVVSDASTLTVDIAPVADAPTLSPLPSFYILNPGSTIITSADKDNALADDLRNKEDFGYGVTQANLEAELGVAAGYLDNRFDPPGNIDPGYVDVFDGKVTEMHYSLKAGTTVSWDYTFANAETGKIDLAYGYNDLVVLVVTDPLGSKSSYLVDSSESKYPNANFSGTYAFEAALDGAYTFQWLVLNGGDELFDSVLTIATPSFVLPGMTESYAAPVDMSPISAGLLDKDGSEVLSVTISGVPIDAIFDSGVKNADGSWTFSAADMASLRLLPAAGYTGTMNLEVTATATEMSTGLSASTTQDMSIEISATTSTYETSTGAAQTLTGTTANDLIRGYAGNDTINAGDGKDMVYGGAGNDTVNGENGDDWLYGGVGNDTINGDVGNDVLQGGVGDDTLTGSAGADTFRWELAERGTTTTPASDTITDFDLTPDSDTLDLRDLLLGELHSGTDAGNLGSFLHFEQSGANTIVKVSTTGAFAGGYDAGAVDQQITLNGIDLTTLGTDQQIIQNLLNNGKLIAD